MAFQRWGYQFEGGYSPGILQSRSGVYVIWCRLDKKKWKVLDVGEAHDVKERVSSHERATCWKKNCSGKIYYSATYTPNLQQAGRKKVEQRIRGLATVPCGER